MNLQPTDIIIRKTDGTETLWLSQRLVMEVCGIEESFLRSKARDRYKKSVRACDLAKSKEFLPDSGKAWRWAKTSNGFYYCLDNIPDRAPKHYRSLFGDAEALRELWENTQNKKASSELQIRFERHLKALYCFCITENSHHHFIIKLLKFFKGHTFPSTRTHNIIPLVKAINRDIDISDFF